MFVDTSLLLSSAQAITTSAASTNLYDVTGAGSGNAPSMTFGVTGSPIGADIGNGDGSSRPTAYFTITTSGTGTGTITFAVEAAPDNGSNSPGTYIRLATSKAWVGTDLDAGNVITLPIPAFAQVAPGMDLPRFYRLYYDQTGNGAVSVTGYILIDPQQGYVSTQIGTNFIAV
jgi:hypothetical protein